MMPAHAVHIVVSGRVHGVGYRRWLSGVAEDRGLAGWVRNRKDGTVEAVLAGEEQAVAAMVAECRRGPRLARVTDVAVDDWAGPALEGFQELPTD